MKTLIYFILITSTVKAQTPYDKYQDSLKSIMSKEMTVFRNDLKDKTAQIISLQKADSAQKKQLSTLKKYVDSSIKSLNDLSVTLDSTQFTIKSKKLSINQTQVIAKPTNDIRALKIKLDILEAVILKLKKALN